MYGSAMLTLRFRMPIGRKGICGIAAMICCLLSVPMGRTQDDPEADAAELPRLPALTPDQSVAALDVEPGFTVVAAVTEPNVADPVAMAFNERGDLYVVEMRGYSERREDNLGTIRLLRDTDGDGFFEMSQVFAEGLQWPTAIICWDGGIFIGATPDIIWMKDHDGDGRADERKTVFTGFGTSVSRLNVQAMLNSFRWGLDNRIHGATAANGGLITRPDQPDLPAVDLRGRDFSFDPLTLDMRREGVTAQHGMSFDDWGRKFTCSNSDHIQTFLHSWHDIPARLSIAVDGPSAEVFRRSPDEPWRIVRTRWRIAGTVGGPVEGGGRVSGYFTAATGITIYRGDAFPDELRGNAFIGDAGSNLIHRKVVSWNEGLPQARRSLNDTGREFVSSSDNWFRPVQFENGPDGCLYVADMYREVIEHPWSLPQGIKQFLDLNSGNDRGRIYRIQPAHHQKSTGGSKDFTAMNPEDIVRHLGHPNAWHREMAARAIHKSKSRRFADLLNGSVSPVGGEAAHNPLFMVHAIMARNGITPLEESEIIDAVETAMNGTHPDFERALFTLLDQFASPGSHLSQKTRGRIIGHVYRHYESVGRSVPQIIAPQILLGSQWVDDDLRIRIAADVLMEYPALGHLSGFAIRGISHPTARRILKHADRLPDSLTMARLLTQLGEIVARESGTTTSSGDWFDLKRDHPIEHLPQLQFLNGFIRHHQQSRESLPSWDDSTQTRIRAITQSIAGHLRQSGYSQPAPDAMIEFLVRQPESARVIELLDSCMSEWPQSRDLLNNLIAAIALRPGETVIAQLTDILDETDAGTRAAVVRTICSSGFVKPLLRKIAARPGHPATMEIPASNVNQWRTSKDSELAALAMKVFGDTPDSDRQSVIDSMIDSLRLKPDRDKGMTQYRNQCATCHRYGSDGAAVGPDLASMKSMGAEKLVIHILDPNREIAPNAIAWDLESIDGNLYRGLLLQKSDESVELLLAGGQKATVEADQVTSLNPTGLSLMPEGLEQSLSQQDLADLIHFILTQ